jgi:FAD binding domain/Berberine and berberine like
MSSLAEALGTMVPAFAGRVLQSTDSGYDDARRLHNGMIDRRPAVIAQCRGTADIADALRLARAQQLEIAVRGGGHNVAGRAVVDRGMMIDLSLMRGVLVDPGAKTAWVEGGATWRDVNRETQAYGLATTGGVISSTGVAGLTLGGGFGWLMPKYGMALDNLVAARLVLADGQIVTASATEHPDLFWAIRGGGGNFGVASAFKFQLHDVGPIVVGGLVAHPFDRARDVLHFYRQMTRSLPEEVFLVAAFMIAPDGSGMKMVGMACVHCGPVADGEAFVRPIKAFGPPVMDVLGPMPYAATNMMLDPTFNSGWRTYWKSHFMPELTDGAIDTLVDHFTRVPTPTSLIIIENFHGASTRVPVADTAYTLRDSGFNMLIASQWTDGAGDAASIGWCRDGFAAMKPFVGSRRYLNYMDGDDMQAETLAAVYGPNLQRLRQIKGMYDPDNVFHYNLNIPPA